MQRLILNVLMEDGTEHYAVKTNLRDQQVYSDMRARHRWAAPNEDGTLMARVLAYSAMRRAGLFQGTYDQFLDATTSVEEVTDEDGEPVREDVDPTRPEASPAP